MKLACTAVTLAVGLLVGCGSSAASQGSRTAHAMSVAENTNAPPPEPYDVPSVPPPPSGNEAAPTGSGTSREDPVMACGPADSYRFVAERFRCPDGTNPFGGDANASRGARVGNVGANSTGHIIDLYRVPCAAGPVDLFIDMYGCPEMQDALGGG